MLTLPPRGQQRNAIDRVIGQPRRAAEAEPVVPHAQIMPLAPAEQRVVLLLDPGEIDAATLAAGVRDEWGAYCAECWSRQHV